MIIKVADNIYRGPRPNTPQDWDELEKLGIKTILSLERGYFEWFHGKLNEEVLIAVNYGIVPIHLQLGDIFPPKQQDLWVALHIIEDAIPRGPVYVHCLHGVDRTGLVCAMVRVEMQKWKPSDAIKEMYALGFHKFPYEFLGWVERLKNAMVLAADIEHAATVKT